MAPHNSNSEREPAYRDAQLHKVMRELRASVKHHPESKKLLATVETRLRHILKVLEQWDAFHAEQAEKLIALGNLPAANVEVTLIFDPDLRAALYPRCYIGDEDDAERLADAVALDRLVLE